MGAGGAEGTDQEKHRKQGYADWRLCFSWTTVSGDLDILLFLVQGGRRLLQVEIFLTKVNDLSQRATAARSSQILSRLLFLKTNQMETTNIP